jgi:hypothetical protein
MPALFAYLIALGLLLGTGYGALNWLAQPEPVKVAAKAKPKAKFPPPAQARSEQIAEASPQATKSAEATAPAAKYGESSTEAKSSAYDRDKASSPRDQQAQAEPSVAAVGQARAPETTAPTPVAGPAPVKEIPAANAEISAEEARRKAEQTAKAAVPADPPRNLQTNTPAPAPPERTVRRRHSNSRQAINHGDRRALAVMTLRTIEFPDGRRITQLIPYGGGER